MNSDLLICAAIDLSGGEWFADVRERLVGSLALGKAGDIRFGSVDGACLAARRDVIPGTEAPRIRQCQMPRQEDGSHVLFAGRLMERDALAAELRVDPAIEDDSLYAQAYMRWGEACDSRIIGEYSSILYWPDQRRVRLARSPLRAPPLHVWRSGSKLVASSLPRSIFAVGVTAEVDADRLADLALFNRRYPEHSLYRGLSRVPCGAQETHDPGGCTQRQFWQLSEIAKAQSASPQQAIEAVSEQFARSARANLERVASPAISLSGGLDSQTSASFLMDELGDRKLTSFTSVPVPEWLPEAGEGLIYDESERVRLLASIYPRLEPQFIDAREVTFGADLERMFLLGSWPTYNEMNMHWVHAIYRAAAGKGADVMFNADMGDAGFSYDGLTAFPGWLVGGRLRRLWKELRALEDGRGLARRAFSTAIWPLVPASWRQAIDKSRGVWTPPMESWCPLDPDHPAVRAALERASDEGHDIGLYARADSTSAREAMLAPTLSEGPEINQSLRLLHGVETRDLTAFRPLFELCASLPDDLFYREGTSRWLARQVAQDRIAADTVTSDAVAIQSTEFLARAERDRELMLSSLSGAMPSNSAANVLNRSRLARELGAIGEPDRGGPNAWLRLACALPRGVAFTRFVQYVEGHNHG